MYITVIPAVVYCDARSQWFTVNASNNVLRYQLLQEVVVGRVFLCFVFRYLVLEKLCVNMLILL